jgi:hypothetical protein
VKGVKRYIAIVALLSVAGGGVALAATAGHRTPHTRAQAALIARKLKDGPRHAHAAAGLTYPDQGVTVTPASSQAPAAAACSGVPTASSAVSAFEQDPASRSAFGPPTGTVTATLATVTEVYPITPGVQVGVPYQAWVVSMPGQPKYFGPATPPANTTCTDVAIYSVQLSTWTERLQSCKAG